MSDYVFKAPIKFLCGESEWRLLYEEYAKTGRTVPASRVKAMFPEQYPNFVLKVAKKVDDITKVE
jgi:hypothetical protein